MWNIFIFNKKDTRTTSMTSLMLNVNVFERITVAEKGYPLKGEGGAGNEVNHLPRNVA